MNRKDNPGDAPNKNDKIYLEYSELLMQAKEYGVGYRVEWEDTLYLVPTPLVRIDAQNRWHSMKEPAIRWKEGKEFYYLHGVNLDKKLWAKIVSGKMKFKEIMKLDNIEQRMCALKIKGAEELLKDAKAKRISQSDRGNELYLVAKVFPRDAYFLKYTCPSTGRVYVSGVDPEVGARGDADECMGWKFRLSKEEYTKLTVEA